MSEPLRFDIKVDNVAAVAAFEGLARALQSLSSRTAGVERVLAMPGAAGASQNLKQLAYQSNATATAMGGLGSPQVLQGLEGFRGKVMTIASAMVGMQIGMTTVGKAMEYFLSSFSKGSQLLSLSRQTNQSVADLVTMQKALTAASLPAESLRYYLMMMNRTMAMASEGSRRLGKDFTKMGIDVEAMKGKTAKEQLLAVAEGLKKLNGTAEQTRVLREIFGRSGPQLMAAFKDEGFMSKLKGGNSEYADLMERNAKLFDSIENGMRALKTRFGEFAAVIAERVGPMLNAMLANFKEFDGASVGKKFAVIGDALKLVITYINAGIGVIRTVIDFFSKHAAITAILAKAIIALGLAYASLKLTEFIRNLGQKVNNFVRSALAIKTETQAVDENTAALLKNSAARGVGGGMKGQSLIPFSGGGGLGVAGKGFVGPQGDVRIKSSVGDGTSIHETTLTSKRLEGIQVGAGASSSALAKLGDNAKVAGAEVGFLSKQLNATSAAGLMAATNIGLFIGMLAQSVLMNWVSQLESATADLKEQASQAKETLAAVEDAKNIKTPEDSKATEKKGIDIEREGNRKEKEAREQLEEMRGKYMWKGYGATEEFLTGQDENNSYASQIKALEAKLAAAQQQQLAGQFIQKEAREAAQITLPTQAEKDLSNSLQGKTDTGTWMDTSAAKIKSIGAELHKLAENRWKFSIEMTKDPSEKIKILNEESKKLSGHLKELVAEAGGMEGLFGGQDEKSQIAESVRDSEMLMRLAKEYEEQGVENPDSKARSSRATYRSQSSQLSGLLTQGEPKDAKERAEYYKKIADLTAQMATVETGSRQKYLVALSKEYAEAAEKAKSSLTETEKLTEKIADNQLETTKRAKELAILKAEASDNFSTVEQLRNEESRSETIRKYQKMAVDNPSEFGGTDDVEGRAKAKLEAEKQANALVDAQIAKSQAAAKLAKDKLESELKIIELRSRGDSVGAAEEERQQKILELTRQYAETLGKTEETKKRIAELSKTMTPEKARAQVDAENKAKAEGMATGRVDNEKKPEQEKSISELRALRLRVQGREQEAVAVERIQKIKEKEKQYADQGFGSKSGAMAKEFVQNEETLKYRKAAPRLTDSLRSVGMDINTHAFSGGGDYRAMGQGGGLGYRAIGQSGGGAGYKGFASAGIDMRSPYEKARGAIGNKGAEAVGPIRPMGAEEYQRATAKNTADIAKNTAPKKTDDPNRGLT